MTTLDQLFVTPKDIINAMCFCPGGLRPGSVLLIEGDQAALDKAHEIFLKATILYGTFKNETKIISQLTIGDKITITQRKMVGLDGKEDVTLYYGDEHNDKLHKLVKSLIENGPKKLDYFIVRNIPHVQVSDIQQVRHILDSRESLASGILFTSSVPDGGQEIADVYVHVKYTDGVLWYILPHMSAYSFIEHADGL